MICNCPTVSGVSVLSHTPDSYVCTTCQDVYINVKLTNDYLKILITFYVDISLVGVTNQTVYQSGTCVKLLTPTTLSKLGEGA